MARHILTQIDADGSAELARKIAPVLRAGDTLLLDGEIGAGKTHFARALIQSILIQPEDIPSPTFTLVQTYDTQLGELWHADLYRLSTPEESDELGLSAAFDSAICLIEWPDRLNPYLPPASLRFRFKSDPDTPDTRQIELSQTTEQGAGLYTRVIDAI